MKKKKKDELEGAQRVHISAKQALHDNVMMYTSTRLHKHLPSNVLAHHGAVYLQTAAHRRTESSIWNGVDIFVDFFTTPTGLGNLDL